MLASSKYLDQVLLQCIGKGYDSDLHILVDTLSFVDGLEAVTVALFAFCMDNPSVIPTKV